MHGGAFSRAVLPVNRRVAAREYPMAKHDPNQRMMRAARNAPYLERDEEHDLAVRWARCGDQEALNRIVLAHMRLVISMASRFRNYGLSMSDLIQEGHVGLLEAASRFDPDRDVRFSTYATWWIRAAIQDHVLRNWSIVRGGTSSAQKALFFNLRRLRARISTSSRDLRAGDVYKEISQALGVSEADVAMMDSRLSGPDASLNTPVIDDGQTVTERQDMLVSDDPLPDETVGEAIDGERRSAWIEDALSVLNTRELSIIRQRRLADDGATLESLGEELGISKERVRQIEARALEKLKAALLDAQPDVAAYSA